jgi:hypothetical protein
MIMCLIASWLLREQPIFMTLLVGQLGLYGIAVAGLLSPTAARATSAVRICAFFLLVNAAAFKAMLLWLAGVRVEVWSPTRRR